MKPGKMRTRVFSAMGLGSQPLAIATRKDIQQHFARNAGRAYPTKMFGDASRVPMEYGARQWGHTAFLQKALKSPALAREIARDPLARIEFEKAIFDGLQERALKGYAEEWRMLSPKAIAALIGRAKKTAAKPTPKIANEQNGLMVSQEAMQLLRKGKTITITDLGCGGGETIMHAIDRIPMESRGKIKVVLVDVMQKGLESTRKKLMRRGLTGKDQVITIRENISTLMRNDKIAQLFGTVDIVTSGAALHHVAAIEPTLEGVNRLLKKGGSFIFWDWGHAAWKAPRLIIAPEGARVDKYGRHIEKGARTKYAEKDTAFVSREKTAGVTKGWRPTEHEGVREMLSTWVSLLNFPKERKAEFLQWFDRKAARGEPIEFGEYLKKLEGAALEQGKQRAEIRYWEGHRPPELYHDAMKNVGLIGEKENPFTIYSTQSPLLYQMKIRKQ